MTNDSARSQLALEGVFNLLRHGFPLAVSDLRDGLVALQAGYGLCRREDLLWLCETLWARNEEEVRFLRLLFREFPQPAADEEAELLGRRAPAAPEPPEDVGEETAKKEDRSESIPAPRFVPSGDSGIGLPVARIPNIRPETFILTPSPAVTLRSLIVTWRRHRRLQRTGPAVEFDLDATIERKARWGFLDAPVMMPARRNQARIVVLIDVSPSMTPWHNLHGLVEESLRESRLGYRAVYYFHNVPHDNLYTNDSLTEPVSIEDMMLRETASSLLIVSDAGAVRGSANPDRARATGEFLARVAGIWWPVAWVNPMPRRRWPQSVAARIARIHGVSMVELTEDGLVQAVDILRGQRIE